MQKDGDQYTLDSESMKILIKVLDREIDWMKYIENNRADIHKKNRQAAKSNRENLEYVKDQLMEIL